MADYVKSLEEKYVNLQVPSYNLKAWYSQREKVFFNCSNPEKDACLESILAKCDFQRCLTLCTTTFQKTWRDLGTKMRTIENLLLIQSPILLSEGAANER